MSFAKSIRIPFLSEHLPVAASRYQPINNDFFKCSKKKFRDIILRPNSDVIAFVKFGKVLNLPITANNLISVVMITPNLHKKAFKVPVLVNVNRS